MSGTRGKSRRKELRSQLVYNNLLNSRFPIALWTSLPHPAPLATHSRPPSLLHKRRKSSRGRTCQVRARTKRKRSREWQPTVSMSPRAPMIQPSRPASIPSTSSTSTTSSPIFTLGGVSFARREAQIQATRRLSNLLIFCVRSALSYRIRAKLSQRFGLHYATSSYVLLVRT